MEKIKVSAFCGFHYNAATTLQIKYIKREFEKMGIPFKLYIFDNKKTKEKNVVSCKGNKMKASFSLFKKLLKDDSNIFWIIKASPYTGFPALFASFLKRKKTCVLIDDYEKAITTKRHGRLQGFVMGLIEKFVIKKSDGVICASKFLYKKFFDKKKRKNGKYKLIPFGIPTERFKNAKNIRKELGYLKKDKVLFYIGSLTKDADVDLAIDALAHGLKKNKNLKLLVVGGGEALEKFKNYAKEKNVSKNVKFTNWINFEEVPNYIFSSDICLMPMKNMEIDEGRCPMKLLEYIAAEKIIIGGSVGMVKYFLPKKLLCKPEDGKALGNKIIEVLQNKELQRLSIKNCKEWKKKHDLKNASKEYYEVMKNLI